MKQLAGAYQICYSSASQASLIRKKFVSLGKTSACPYHSKTRSMT